MDYSKARAELLDARAEAWGVYLEIGRINLPSRMSPEDARDQVMEVISKLAEATEAAHRAYDAIPQAARNGLEVV